MPSAPAAFPFRPWIRSTSRKAMLWGVGVVALLGGVTWLFRTPGTAPLGRAFGSLAFYGLLFWASLLKVWWTGGRPAVLVDDEALAYQPLHTFRPRTLPFARVLECAPRQGTQSLRLVHEASRGRAREFFLNLGVIQGRNEFLDLLGEKLEAAGVVAVAGKKHTWRRPGWEE